jgi:hypothetical protein
MAVLYRDPAASPAPPAYTAARSATPAGLLAPDDQAWQVVREISWGPVAYRTAFQALACDQALHLRFTCADPAPWSTQTARDAHLWEEEVVEIFLDPVGNGRDYYELEISPANVVCDLRVASPWPALEADLTWNLDGLETACAPLADGTGWSATARLPFAGLAALSTEAARVVPPVPGSAPWRFNVFRIKRPGGPAAPEQDAVYAAWAVPDAPSFHVPAVFRELRFGR